MRTLNFSLLTLLSLTMLLVTSCMPDSFTKFKEDPPTKTSASGGQAGDVTPAEDEVEEDPDLLYEIEEAFLLQSEGDIYFFGVLDGTSFNVGDTLWVSKEVATTGGTRAGTITHVGVNPTEAGADSGNARVIGVRLGSDITTPASNADKDNALTTAYNTDTISSADDNVLANGYFIDNCTTGYGLCTVGASSVTQIDSPIFLYVPPTAPSSGKNIDKRIYIKRGDATNTLALTSSFEFEYSLSPDPVGIGFENTGGSPYLVRIASPEGPFLSQDTGSITETPTTLTVSLKVDGTVNKVLDPEESFSIDFYYTSTAPVAVGSDAVADYELTYYLENGDEFAVKVDSVANFAVGETVRACASINNSACDQDDEALSTIGNPAILGKATIRHIETATNTLFLTAATFDPDGTDALTTRKPIFREGLFIHNSSGEVAIQTGDTMRLFRPNDGTKTLVPDYNVQNDATDDPSSVSYTATGLASGMTISASTGNISIDTNSIDLSLDTNIEVTAKNAFTGETLDTFKINVNIFGWLAGLTHADNNSSFTLNAEIGSSASTTLVVQDDTDSNELEGENFDFGRVRFIATTTLPTGVNLNSETGEITWEPTAFLATASQGPYTIEAYQDSYDRDNEFGSVTITFKSATTIANYYFPQQASQSLILKVNDTSQFFESTSTVNLSNPDGGQGIVQTIDAANNLLYVTIDSGTNLAGPQTFKVGDKLDTTSSYVVERGIIEEVTYVFTTTDIDLTQGSSDLTPALYDANGAALTLATDEVNALKWSISPTLPTDLRFSGAAAGATTATGGSGIIEAAAAGAPSLSPLDASEYTVFVESETGEVTSGKIKFAISSSPGRVSAGRYQFVRLSGNGGRFFRGSTISTADSLKGRVLMPIDIDNDGTNDGILTEFNGDIADNIGIDNVGVYAAAEATAVPYVFLDIKDSVSLAGLSAGDTMTASDGDTVVVVSTTGSRVYARVSSGEIAPGDILEEGGTSYPVISVEDRHYINGVLQINNNPIATSPAIEVGSIISLSTASNGGGASDAKAIVVQRAFSGGNFYLLVQQYSDSTTDAGSTFDEADFITASDTPGASDYQITSIVGPNISIAIAGGDPGANYSSSNLRAGASNNVPFWEGSLITGWLDTGTTFTSSGYAVAGTEYSTAGTAGASNIVVNVEDYGTHFRYDGANDFIDDFSEATAAMTATTHNVIQGISLSNLVIGYVDEPIQIEPTVTGGFALATLNPASLPAGLSFDSANGRITGTPSEYAAVQDYTITFQSADGTSSTSYTFPFVVYNHFTINADTENASSYVMHREGQGLGTSRCRVFSPQINDDITNTNLYNQAVYGTNDIVCFMEGAENDLFVQGIDWNINSGAGMCEYVRYVPYSFTEYATGDTDAEFVIYESSSNTSQCAGIGVANITISGTNAAAYLSAADIDTGIPLAGRAFGQTYCQSGTTCTAGEVASPACLYDYTSIDGPNVDEGKYETRTVTCSFTAGVDAGDGAGGAADGDFDDPEDTQPACECTVNDPQETECNGTPDEVIQGPVRDVFSQLEATSQIYSSFNGIQEQESVSSPISFTPDKTNAYLANYVNFSDTTRDYVGGTAANSCFSGTYNFETYNSPGNLTTGRTAWIDYLFNGAGYASTSNATPSKFYNFECFDAGFNLKARVRVLVRDWDREFSPESSELENVSNASGATATMDNTSTSACFGSPCNSRADLDDLIFGVGDFAIAGDCGSGTLTTGAANTTTRVTLTEGSAILTVTAGTTPSVGATVVIDPAGLNIPATVRGVNGADITVDKLMPNAGTTIQVNIISAIPTF